MKIRGSLAGVCYTCRRTNERYHELVNDTKAFNIEKVHRMANNPCGFRYSDHSSCLFAGLLDMRPSALDSGKILGITSTNHFYMSILMLTLLLPFPHLPFDSNPSCSADTIAHLCPLKIKLVLRFDQIPFTCVHRRQL